MKIQLIKAGARRRHMIGFAVLIAALALTACVDRILNISLFAVRDWEYNIDTNSSLSEEDFLTRGDVLGELDIDDDADVTNVEIQSVQLLLGAFPGNTATSANVEIVYDPDNAAPSTLANIQIPISASGEADTIAVNTLVAAVVNNVEDDFELMLTQSGGPTQMLFRATVTARSPTGSRLLIGAMVRVRLTIDFIDCVSLPWFVGPQLEDCDGGSIILGGGQ